ncbi:MAG: hypothetical protein CL843_00560 [Crocinitomicaceae bacterium]|nr:hypothetical protein [Crocinitomicaceae bacterium]|tara:strand:- start:10263 stop:10976 length:714 start_codon:yes stop_codon:yes gene_type:complete
MKQLKLVCLLLPLFIFSGCKDDDNDSSIKTGIYLYRFDASDTKEWNAFFSDYPQDQESFYQLEFGVTPLPDPLDASVYALRISGNNHSDDLLSFIYRPVGGLAPNTTYKATFELEIASNALTNGIGIGGDPNLALGVGGISYPPENTLDDLGMYRPNFNSSLQSGEANEVFALAGNIGVNPEYSNTFRTAYRDNADSPIELTSNENGELWLMIATDSGYEGITTLYYSSIFIQLQPI